jgi:Domain of unknown function (DUF4349)
MRLLDQDPIDPEIAATLDAIDATLAGEPVDARFAELAEIALLLNADRPQPAPEFASSMDQRVARRFAPAAGSAVAARSDGRRRVARRFWEGTGALAAGVALVVAIVVVTGGGGGGSSASSSSATSYSSVGSASGAASSGAAASSPSAASSAPRALSAPATRHASASSPSKAATSGSAATSGTAAPSPQTSGAQASGAQASGAQASGAQASGALTTPVLQPPTTGRKVVQSAQLNLTAAPNRIDSVAQEIYDVVGQVNGIVNSSSITQGGPAGFANFQLSVPSSALGQTMTKLSSLSFAQVVSSTNNTQDITNQYNATATALADARAVRTSLLKQLANAVTTEQVDSLTARIHDAEASISSDLATLGKLNQQVNFSQLQVTINARAVPTPVGHKSGGFGIGRAAHDSGRVLSVVAGGALIAVAALTPLALVVALAWWVGAALKRRRREQALDSV